MGADVLVVKDKVQRYLVDLFGGVQVDRDGDFTFRQGSTQVWLTVTPFGDTNTVVKVFSFTNLDIPSTPELFHHVATHNAYAFGHLMCREADGKVRVQFAHALLGEFLDPDELKVAVFMVASVADTVDAEIKAKFGGRLFHEE